MLRLNNTVLAKALLIPALLSTTSTTLLNMAHSAVAAPVGTSQTANFGQAVLASSCTLSTTDGSLGVRTNRSLITSDVAEGGNFNGTLAAATIAASSNLTSAGFVRVDNPLLASTSATATTAGSATVKIGSSDSWGNSAQINLGTDGELPATPLHVRFTPSGNRFGNGTYSASATVSCYDS